MSTAEMKRKVETAHKIQKHRKQFNSELKGKALGMHCRLPENAQEMMRDAFQVLGLSMRAYERVLRIARTIADLEHAETIDKEHLAEALRYRARDRKYKEVIR